MIEVRLFATLREGREKIQLLPAQDYPTGESILSLLNIPAGDVAIFLINGIHSKPYQSVKDGDVVAIFPPVGGG